MHARGPPSAPDARQRLGQGSRCRLARELALRVPPDDLGDLLSHRRTRRLPVAGVANADRLPGDGAQGLAALPQEGHGLLEESHCRGRPVEEAETREAQAAPAGDLQEDMLHLAGVAAAAVPAAGVVLSAVQRRGDRQAPTLAVDLERRQERPGDVRRGRLSDPSGEVRVGLERLDVDVAEEPQRVGFGTGAGAGARTLEAQAPGGHRREGHEAEQRPAHFLRGGGVQWGGRGRRGPAGVRAVTPRPRPQGLTFLRSLQPSITRSRMATSLSRTHLRGS
mmetsp:Transcript_58623/g.182060  ORF Transcript_58623/g.182060 Transcript_58623/m.182060 type:complete len:279 (+) Transcript_58623:62-898(+)